MHELKYAFRRFYRGGSLNVIKIISLALGLALSFLLLAKVANELSFNHNIEGHEHIYQISSFLKRQNQDAKEFGSIPGAVVPGMQKEIAEVEAGTRWTGFTDESVFYLDNKRSIDYELAVLTDTSFFDVFTTEVMQGNPKEVLSQKMQCMISDALAEKIGPNAVGQQIQFRSYPNVTLTIGGIYKRFSKNCFLEMDVLVSMPSIGAFIWDGSENWLGNDRYKGFVKLAAGTDHTALGESIRKMQQKYYDIEKMEREENLHFTFKLQPLDSLHLADSSARTSVLLIALIGAIVLAMSLLNYLLLRISSIVNNSKGTSIRKSLGAERRDIVRGIVTDTTFHLTLALLLAIAFVVAFQRLLNEIFDVPPTAYLTPSNILLGVGILLVTGILISLWPSRIVANQSVVQTIRSYTKRGRQWKKGLLFIEGLGVTFLLCIVFFVQTQYRHSIQSDKGFRVENIFSLPTASLDSVGIKNAMQRLRNMPEVTNVSLAYTTPFGGSQSGDNLFDPASRKEIRNVADFFWCDENYFDLLEIPIVEGQGFDVAACHSKHALVNETFAQLLIGDFGWTDGVVGKPISVTSHNNPMTIVGVFKDIKICRFGKPFSRDESIVIAGGAYHRACSVMLLKLTNSLPSTLAEVEKVINEYTAFGDEKLYSATKQIKDIYSEMRSLGHYTLFGSIVAIAIALIGIIGYTEEEVTQRRKEVAIRKVNGASTRDILRLFIVRYLKIGIPAVLIGMVGAFIAIRQWQQSLTDPAALAVWAFFAIGVGVVVVSCAILGLYSFYAASQTPTKYLKAEL